jgi:hypothetical protein
MIQNINKNGILKHFDILFESLTKICQRSELKSAHFGSAFASFLYNYSISCI